MKIRTTQHHADTVSDCTVERTAPRGEGLLRLLLLLSTRPKGARLGT